MVPSPNVLLLTNVGCLLAGKKTFAGWSYTTFIDNSHYFQKELVNEIDIHVQRKNKGRTRKNKGRTKEEQRKKGSWRTDLCRSVRPRWEILSFPDCQASLYRPHTWSRPQIILSSVFRVPFIQEFMILSRGREREQRDCLVRSCRAWLKVPSIRVGRSWSTKMRRGGSLVKVIVRNIQPMALISNVKRWVTRDEKTRKINVDYIHGVTNT